MGRKFFIKNKKQIKEFHSFIENNDVIQIICSFEVFELLLILKDFKVGIDSGSLYCKNGMYLNKIRVLGYIYIPSDTLRFILRKNIIKFNIPCICGKYKDEKHDHI